MIDHAELHATLRARLLTAAGLATNMCAWLNANYKTEATYLETDFVPATNKRITIGDSAVLEETGLFVVRVFATVTAGEEVLYGLVDAVLARFDLTWAAALSGNTTLYVRGDIAPVPGQIRPAIGSRAYVPITIPWLARTRNQAAA